MSDTPKRPDGNEIATTGDGRDITRGWVSPNWLLPPEDTVLRARGGGNLEIYREVLRDEQVAATFAQRRLAVVSKEWEVQPGGKKRQDKAAADFLREQLKAVNFDRATDTMLYGVFYGYSVAECLWAREGRYVTLDDIKVRDRRRFAFDGAYRLRLRTMHDPMPGELLPPAKFWHFRTGADHDDEPYGLGLAHWLYWPVQFKRQGMKFWLIFLEKFGQPTARGTYPANATAEERTRLLQALRAIQTDSGLIIPEGMQVDLIEAARSGTADYTALYDRMDKAIAKAVLGQTASTEGTAGKLGNETLQQEVRADLVKADADLVCESFNRTVARWLTTWNFPTASAPRVWRRVEEPEDTNKLAERDQRIYQMGYKPTLGYITDVYGGEWTETSPAPAVPTTPATAAFAEGDATDSVDQQTARLGREADVPIRDMITVIRTLLDKAGSLEQFRDALIDAYPTLSTDHFAEMMAKALTAAELAGRYDIVEQALGG